MCVTTLMLRSRPGRPPAVMHEVVRGVAERLSASAWSKETSVRALVKLEQVLPAHLRRRVAALGSATIVAGVGGPTVDPQHLTIIAAACRDSECLRFAYRSRDGTDTRREVEPHSLVNYWRRWYLVAWDRARAGWRTFRVDRLSRPAAMGIRFTARRLPAKDAAAYVEQSIAGGSRYEAHVTVHASADEVAKRLPYLSGTLEPIDARRCVYRTADDDLEWLAIRIAMLAVEIEVHGPPELISHLNALARRLRRATGESADRANVP
jgi:predicted DNA-binding transcriptional regulator YafY